MKYFVFIFFLPSITYSQKFKVRAREHFESHSIKLGNNNYKYKGLSNTLNFWWEQPYSLSYGFSLSPILSNLKTSDPSPLGKKVTYWNLGFELKYHFYEKNKSFFIRPGIGYSILKPDSIFEDAKGYFLYSGLGYEIPFEKFGLALEFAYRYSKLSKSIEISSITPSIGFHFYENF